MYYGCNRYMCDVFEEIRKIIKLFSENIEISDTAISKVAIPTLSTLIEEAQVMGNRMEGALGDLRDLESLHDDITKKKKIYVQLEKEIKKLELKKEELNGNRDIQK